MKTFIVLGLLFFLQFAEANQCSEIFIKTHLKNESDPVDVSFERAQLISAIKQHQLPGFKIKMNNGEVPVILMTEQSYPFMKDYLHSSYGTQIMTKQGWPNDHGSFRYQEYLIDAYIAGERQFGEIHETGLSWKTAEDSIRFVDKIADVFIESSFRLNRSEMNAIDFYQKVRRLALFRVVFPMGNEAIYQKLDNVLSECREHCFQFSTSQNLAGQRQALEQRIQKLLPAPVDYQKSLETAKPLISEIREQVLAMNPLDIERFHKQYLETPERVAKLSEILGGNFNDVDVKTLLMYMVGVEAVKQFETVISEMKQTSAVAFENQKRLTAVLIWTTADQAEAVNNLSFQAKGRSFSFLNTNNWEKIHE